MMTGTFEPSPIKAAGLHVPTSVRISSSKYLLSRLPFFLTAVKAPTAQLVIRDLTLDHVSLLSQLNLGPGALTRFSHETWVEALRRVADGRLGEDCATHGLRSPQPILHAGIAAVCIYGTAIIPYPQGCNIPGRSISGISALANVFGITIQDDGSNLILEAPNGIAAKVNPFISIQSTMLLEIALICGLFSRSQPEIFATYLSSDMRWLLRQLKIPYKLCAATSVWTINLGAREKRKEWTLKVPSDRCEMVFWALLGGATRKAILIDLDERPPEAPPLAHWGLERKIDATRSIVGGDHCIAGFDLCLNGQGFFISDDGPSLCGFAVSLKERSSICDGRWPLRLQHVDLLATLGFGVSGNNGRTIVVPIHKPIDGEVLVNDIRTVCALTIAAASAGIEVRIRNATEVERGIARFWNKLES